MDAPDYSERHAELVKERKRLVDLDKNNRKHDKTEYVETGLTLDVYWRTLNTQDKRQFLVQNGIRLEAASGGRKGLPLVEWKTPRPSKVIRLSEAPLAA
jgi:hypothetical protein